jgi:hypothetical protein
MRQEETMLFHEIPTVSDGKPGWQAVLFDGHAFRSIAYVYANTAEEAAALVEAVLGENPASPRHWRVG